jgi:hypothetical protein
MTRTNLMTRLTTVVLAALTLSVGTLQAQDEDLIHPSYEWLRLGATAAFDQRWLNGSFKGLPDVPSCCPEYTSTTAAGLSGGLIVEIPVTGRFTTGVRLTFTQLGGDFLAYENELVYAGEVESVDATFEHSLKPRVTALMFEPNATYNPVAALTLGLGVQIGYAAVSSFEQTETLVTPDNIVFENGSRVRNARSGEIPTQNTFQVALTGRVGYEWALDAIGQITLGPELSYSHALTNVVDGINWKTNDLRLGVVFRYSLLREVRP